MKAFLALLALPAFFASAIAAPAPVAESDIVKRDPATDAYNDVAVLYTQVKKYTGSINSTVKSLNSHSTAAQNASAQNIIIADINAIFSLVNATDSLILKLVSGLKPTTAELTALSKLVEDLILEINGALTLVEDVLGVVQAILQSLQPLVKLLSKLIYDLDKVVDGVLLLVKKLVDGILLGLSKYLNGLVL